jgi:hypothetical protein
MVCDLNDIHRIVYRRHGSETDKNNVSPMCLFSCNWLLIQQPLLFDSSWLKISSKMHLNLFHYLFIIIYFLKNICGVMCFYFICYITTSFNKVQWIAAFEQPATPMLGKVVVNYFYTHNKFCPMVDSNPCMWSSTYLVGT